MYMRLTVYLCIFNLVLLATNMRDGAPPADCLELTILQLIISYVD